jgi:hypothetical protein
MNVKETEDKDVSRIGVAWGSIIYRLINFRVLYKKEIGL